MRLLDGRFTGHFAQALDTACTLYLASTGDHPPEPLKDLRGAAWYAEELLAHRRYARDVEVAADGRDGVAILIADGKREAGKGKIDFVRRHGRRPSRFRAEPGRRAARAVLTILSAHERSPRPCHSTPCRPYAYRRGDDPG